MFSALETLLHEGVAEARWGGDGDGVEGGVVDEMLVCGVGDCDVVF